MTTNQRVLGKVFFVLSMAAVCGGAAFGRDIHVCSTCAHKTIQSAVNDAVSGDSVLVAQGTYVENVTITGKALDVVGGPGITSIVGAGRGPVFTLGTPTVEGTPFLVGISNFTISGGNHLSGTGDGGGIQVRAGAYLNLSNSIVTGNVAVSGAGISMSTVPGPDYGFANQISQCYIQNNTATAAAGANGIGGGVALLEGNAIIEASVITQNQANEGAGVYEGAHAHALIVDDTTISLNIADGSSGGRGGGLFVASFIRMSFDQVSANRSFGDGSAGMYLIPTFPPPDVYGDAGSDIESTDFSNNQAGRHTPNPAGLVIGTPAKSTGGSAGVFMTDVAVVLNSGYGIVNNGAILGVNVLVQLNSLGNCSGSGSGCP
jgi:hypothetical protein